MATAAPRLFMSVSLYNSVSGAYYSANLVTASTAWEHPEASTSYSFLLEGKITPDRYLRRPVPVIVEDDEGEYLVSEPHFHMHAAAATVPDALGAFRRVLSGYLDVLESRENTLGAHLHEQLGYLRSIIGRV